MNRLLTQGFSGFLRRRGALRHFQRRPLLEALVVGAAPVGPAADFASPRVVSGAAQAGQGAALLAAARDEPAQALLRLMSRAEGLDTADAAQRLARTYLLRHFGRARQGALRTAPSACTFVAAAIWPTASRLAHHG